MNWFNQLQRWFRLTLDLGQRYTSIRVGDTPDEMKDGVVYLVGDGPQPWFAWMTCPCGCGEVISLSLLPGDKPRWTVIATGGGITLHPSIWRTKGCRSHFFLKRGRLQWIHDE